MKKKILIVVGTRPNFVKITQFKRVAKKYQNLDLRIVHTGQHYDEKMSDIFLKQFKIEVDYFLGINSTSANNLIGKIIIELETIITGFKPHLLLCVGDVNSTLAAAICANKLDVKLGHIESGLRSLDRKMPEEINRILTDEISDICFVTEKSGLQNLKNNGKADPQIAFVGNTMIDTLVHFNDEIEASTILSDISQEKGKYILLTMHRPRNVDTKKALLKIIDLCINSAQKRNIIFPMHHRTKSSLIKHDLLDTLKRIDHLIIIEAQNYFSFQKLIKHSFCVITDSGGIQEETTFLQIPCITLRENTERPSTTEEGTNELMALDIQKIAKKIQKIAEGKNNKGTIPKYWDGNATERIIEKAMNFLS